MSSEKGFQQISFVNSIATTKGGRHVDHVTDQVTQAIVMSSDDDVVCLQITKKLVEVVKKNKGGVEVKPYQVTKIGLF